MYRITLFVALVLTACFLEAATFSHPERKFQVDYDDSSWEIVVEDAKAKSRADDNDKAVAQRTLVTLQRRVADDKYHARFSVVVDSLAKFPGVPAERLVKYRKHAVDFLKGQRFHLFETHDYTLPKIGTLGFETLASQRDFGLMFKQVVFLRSEEAFLLTAATRTDKFDGYKPELTKLFDSFRFSP